MALPLMDAAIDTNEGQRIVFTVTPKPPAEFGDNPLKGLDL
jgi:hypothetical protein